MSGLKEHNDGLTPADEEAVLRTRALEEGEQPLSAKKLQEHLAVRKMIEEVQDEETKEDL